MKVGFIGLGNMGGPMATNLVAAGHEVTGFDIAAALPPGVVAATDARAAASEQDAVITMLPDASSVSRVAAEILPAIKDAGATAVYLDCSTIDVQTARSVATDAQALGIEAMDAPVSGGVKGAAAGTLTFMVGGDEETFNVMQPLFDVMGNRAVLCGPVGNGQAAKICNNMMAAVSTVVASEAFVLADKLGLARDKMYDVVSTSSGASWIFENMCPAPGVGPDSPADHGYQPGFAASLMLKDLRLSQSAAGNVGANTPMGALATSLFTQFVETQGHGDLDLTAILTQFE